MIKFKDKTHEDKFYITLSRMRKNDKYHQAMAYIIALYDIPYIYKFYEDEINYEIINDLDWSAEETRATRLAFNLHSEYTDDYTSVSELICSKNKNNKYLIEAIRIVFDNEH